MDEKLLKFWRTIAAFEQLLSLAQWDRETKMPSGSASQRAEQVAALTQEVNSRLSSKQFGDLLEESRSASHSDLARANLRVLERRRRDAVAVPGELEAAIAKATTIAVGNWESARAKDDVSIFLPDLKNIVSLKQEEASALANGGERYDALLGQYEPGVSVGWIAETFAHLRCELVRLRDKILGANSGSRKINFKFSSDQQIQFAHRLPRRFGFDWARGRLDLSAHPFTSGQGDDVRITTRTNVNNIFDCVYSVIHETGHGVYEQSIQSDFAMTPVGTCASLGIHESQARYFENQIGRSESFSDWLFHALKSEFGDFGISTSREFYEENNRVDCNPVRTEADEVQYNLHIMMRFDLEKQLMSGALDVSDVEEAWNERFAADFGFPVKRPSQGVLQDVHWAAGAFGYFPTYTLGNIYGGCLHSAICREVPSMKESLKKGDPMPVVEWMQKKVQRHGALLEPLTLIRNATGDQVSERPLVEHLNKKFSDIYRI